MALGTRQDTGAGSSGDKPVACKAMPKPKKRVDTPDSMSDHAVVLLHIALLQKYMDVLHQRLPLQLKLFFVAPKRTPSFLIFLLVWHPKI
jgi:hypothetical protein